MLAVLMVQPSLDQIVGMVAMGHRLVATTRPVDVILAMSVGPLALVAAIRVLIGDFDHMLVDMVLMRVVQMAIVQIIDMSFMPNGSVAAFRPVHVRMIGVGLVLTRH
jgi:hypothetical protein